MVGKGEIKNLLQDWQGRVAPAIDARMEHLFESADEVLFDYADKAESNVIQSKFLDGRRELWQKKNDVALVFHDKLARELLEFMRPAERADAPGSETLSLVSKDTFERSLAIQTISDQAVEKNKELYYALSQRLGVITGGPAIAFEDLPAGPHQLAGMFEITVQTLNVERQVLLALYTLFEREVIRQSPPWHEELNETLREKGILPNLKYQFKRHPDAPGPDVTGTDVTATDAPVAEAASPGVSAADDGARPDWQLPSYPGIEQYESPPSAGVRAGDGYGPESASAEQGHQQHGEAGARVSEQLLGRIRELLTARRAAMSRAAGGAMRPDPVNPAPSTVVAATADSPVVRQAAAMPNTGTLDAGVRKVVVPRELLERVRNALEVQRQRIKETVGDDKLSHFDEDTIDIVGMLFEVMLNDNRLSNTVKALLSHLHTPYLKLAVRDRAFLKRVDHPARHLFDNMIEAGSRWVDEQDLTQGIYPKLQRVVDLIMRAGEHPLQLLQELDEGLSAEIALRSRRQQAREVRTIEAEKGKARLEEARETAVQATQPFLEAGETPVRFLEFVSGPWTDYLTLLYLRSNGDTGGGAWRSALQLCQRLRDYVDEWVDGDRPKASGLKGLQDELRMRLADAIPHYEEKVVQLFEMFSGDYEVSIVARHPAAPSTPTAKPAVSASIEELLRRLPKLPPESWVAFHNSDGTDRVLKLSWYNDKTERFLFVDQNGAKALIMPLQKLAEQIDRERAHVMHETGTSYVESSLQRALSALEKRA